MDPRCLRAPKRERHDPEDPEGPSDPVNPVNPVDPTDGPGASLQACKPGRSLQACALQGQSALSTGVPPAVSLVSLCSAALPDAPHRPVSCWPPRELEPFAARRIAFCWTGDLPSCPHVTARPNLGSNLLRDGQSPPVPQPEGWRYALLTHSLHTPCTLPPPALSLISVSTPRRESSLSLL